MKKIVCIPVLVLSLLVEPAQACSCAYGGSFVKMAAKKDFVALVKVLRFQRFIPIDNGRDTIMPLSMEVEVIEKYKGSENRKIVTVWGDNGMLCRPYINSFAVGKHYLIAFQPAGFNNESKDDYSISVCGSYWLSVDRLKQTAQGDIDHEDAANREQQTLTLSQVKNKIIQKYE